MSDTQTERPLPVGRQSAPAHAPDLHSNDDRIVAAAALGLAAGAAGVTTPLPRAAFLEVLEEYLRQPSRRE